MKKAKSLADILFPVVEDEDLLVIDIPPEQRRLHTESYDFSIATIVDYLEKESIFIPEFQRKYVWTRSQASRLIESLIIQCPIPVIYLNQERDERLSVIDGNQRITSIKLFLKDTFPLQGLTTYPELEGSYYSELDPRIQRHINNRTLRCITILKETHPQIKFDVFERINTGAVQLNPQEVRHGIYHGNLLSMIDSLVKDKIWKELTGIKDDVRMKGSELILRFFALLKNQENYQKPLKKFLNDFSLSHQNISEKDAARFRNEFLTTLYIAGDLLGKKAFRTLKDKDTVSSNNLNAALFDATMIGLHRAKISRKDLEDIDIKLFMQKYTEAITSPEFLESISSGTSAKALVNYRINTLTAFFSNYFS